MKPGKSLFILMLCTGAKVAVCELPFDYKSSDRLGGVGGT